MEFLGHRYGTPLPDPPVGSDLLLEIDVRGASEVKRLYPHAVVVLVVAPSAEVQASRLRRRGDDEDHVRSRLELGEVEVRQGLSLADHVVVNDDVERALTEIRGIVADRRRDCDLCR